MNLQAVVESIPLTLDQIGARTQLIRETILADSAYLKGPNFQRIHTSDMRNLFYAYDSEFFEKQMTSALEGTRLDFGLSSRMTSAGGKTTRILNRQTGAYHYEISIATSMLFGCFTDNDHRPIDVCGIPCRDRFDALQRIFEHELVHLIEMLVWGESSCSRPRFQSISQRRFGHLQASHRLITPKERAAVEYGIRPGIKVQFSYEGKVYAGIVNRVAKRATVLVESATGERYSDGKMYAKFYVPLSLLAVDPN